MKTKTFKSIVIKSIAGILVVLVLSHCNDKVQVPPKTNDELVVSEYIAVNNDYSEFNKMVVSVGLNNVLGIRGPYTLFLPTNSAMFAYYAEKNIKSYTDLDTSTRKELVYNHVVPNAYSVTDFQEGTLPTKNGLGDNIVTEFQGAEIYVNKFSRIIKRDIQVSNGTIQIIDKVIEPIKLGVYDYLAGNPSYSIFAEGLKRTGIKDTLQVISFKFGLADARTRYTILAIADTTFKRLGINSIDDLINKYNKGDNNIYKNPGNGFYDYMDFHCLDRNAYYLSDFASAATLYSVLSKNNNIQVKIVNGIFEINFNTVDSTYTTFYLDQSDLPAKNGVIHTINKLMEVSIPSTTAVIWEVTDYFDLKQGEYYLKHFQKFFDTAQFEGIRWHGDYLQYYIKAAKDAQPELNDDCLNMLGFWDITVTTPKFMAGHYIVASRVWTGLAFAVYIDGVQTAAFTAASAASEKSAAPADASQLYNFGEVTWTTTTTHKIRLKALASNTLFWDRIELHPIR
jgi:uncharacterized surface protein with fasciclin (FAS1) repeats